MFMDNIKDKSSTVISIIIIEDDAYMREGWTTVLDFEDDFCVTGTFENCEDALDSPHLDQADVFLMDIGLPGMSGTECISHIHKRNPEAIVIMATVFEDDNHIFEALMEGAIGYLQKKVSPSELVHAIKTAYNGGSPMSPGIARKVIRSFQVDIKDSETEPLIEREKMILQELARGKSYRNISDQIHLSVDGVRYHIRNIYSKLQVNSRTEAVAKAIRNNIIKPE